MNFKNRFVIAATVTIAVLAVGAVAAPQISTDAGKIVGTRRGGIDRFFGISYAAPPVGENRWKAPQPAAPWTGVKEALEFGPVCRQTATWVVAAQSEDCLSLNIWAPAKKAKKPYPVLVWIHGGGLRSGSGVLFRPDGGDSIVRQDVILITINYRLGVFGFFAHPELSAESADHASGNQGFLDQIAALKWIQRNIAAFGGDPDRVTVAGESAGASSVMALTVSPLARGLFQRAIAESGVYPPLEPLQAAEAKGSAFTGTAGAASLAGLRDLAPEMLLHLPWQPSANQDGHFFPAQMPSIAEGLRGNTVPILVGWNADEGIDLAPEFFGAGNLTAAAHPHILKTMSGREPPPPLLQLYPGTDDKTAKDSLERFVTDAIMGYGAWNLAAKQMAAAKASAYLYFYIHSPVEPPGSCGYGCKAGHGAEIRFAFGQLHQDKRPWSEEDKALEQEMVLYWTNFAKTGDPNSKNTAPWPVFDGTPQSVKRLGTEAEIKERGAFPDFRLFQNADGN